MAHRIASRRLPALRNIAAGLALIVAPALLYLGVGGQAAQAATSPDWTLQAGGTTVCTTFTGFSWGTTPTSPTHPVSQTVGILSGGSLTCDPQIAELEKNKVPETFTASHVMCSAGTPTEVQYVFGGASVSEVQFTGGAGSTVEAQFTFQTEANTLTQLGGSC
jgi:hypothetical protein